VALAIVVSSAVASAQAPAQAPAMNMADHRGALQGRVRDAQGAPVPDAPVTAINDENGAQFVATTNAQGAFEFGALPMGKYTVTTASAGKPIRPVGVSRPAVLRWGGELSQAAVRAQRR